MSSNISIKQVSNTIYFSVTPLKLRLSIILSIKQIYSIYSPTMMLSDLYIHNIKIYQKYQSYLKRFVVDKETEKAIKTKFYPSFTALTSINCLNENIETLLRQKASSNECIKTLLESIDFLSNNKCSISKLFIIKNRKSNF